MGFFDRFKKPPPAAPPPEPPAAPSADLPRVPFFGSIASFQPGDGIGTITVEGQSPVRFGRSACRGFEPAPGVTVEVTEVSEHPLGGFRATRVEMKSDAAAYDALLEQRDASLGIQQPKLDAVGQAAAASQVLGWAIVLLKSAPPAGPAAFLEWAKNLGLEKAGIRIKTDGGVHLGIGRHDAIAHVGTGPFPAQRLADLGAPEGYDPGQGFIGLSLGLPGSVQMFRVTGKDFDPWAADGQMRDMSRLALALSEHAVAVILPQAGTLLGAQSFRARVGDPDDLTCRPFGAWIGHSVNDDEGTYSTFGMVLQALPDVVVPVDVKDRWELDRAEEALLVACSTMAHSNQALAPGQKLKVSVGQPIGPAPMLPIEGDAEQYTVEAETLDPAAVIATEIQQGVSMATGRIRLKRSAASVRSRWATPVSGRAARVGANTYRELFRTAFARGLGAETINGLTPNLEADDPPFEIDVWEANDETGFFMTSTGVGRLAQRFGTMPDRTDHIEFVAAMGQHDPLIANAMAVVALHVHRQADPSQLFKTGDTVGIAIPELRSAGFILRDAGSLAIAEGPKVHLLEVIPASAEEYAEAKRLGSGPFRERVGKMSPAARAQRWTLLKS